MPVLQSNWDGLNKSLLAVFYPLKMAEGGDNWSFVPDGDIVVAAPITECSLDQAQNWTSPFENSAPDAAFSTFSAMLQLGALKPVFNALLKNFPILAEPITGVMSAADSMAGRSSATKLNSAQIYSGSPPLTISATLHFRALSDPITEVARPVSQMLQWSVPRKLAPYGAVTSVAAGTTGGDALRTVYASETPPLMAMMYRGKLYSPMVIESIAKPLDSPCDALGRDLNTQLQIKLGSLTAVDKADMIKMGYS